MFCQQINYGEKNFLFWSFLDFEITEEKLYTSFIEVGLIELYDCNWVSLLLTIACSLSLSAVHPHEYINNLVTC